MRTPKRTIVPLSVDEVARSWSSFRTSRDLAIVGLKLVQGLRSKEVLDLNSEDLLLNEAQIRRRVKGNKNRYLFMGLSFQDEQNNQKARTAYQKAIALDGVNENPALPLRKK